MSPDRCPIKGCTYTKRLVLCPYHWDLVDPAQKMAVYNLSQDLQYGELDDSTFEETTAKLLEIQEEIVKALNARSAGA